MAAARQDADIRRDVGDLEGGRIGRPVMHVDVPDEDRPLLGHAVELGHRQVAALEQVVEVIGGQPSALRQLGVERLEAGDQLGAGRVGRVADIGEEFGEQRHEAGMLVGVDEAGKERAPAEVDHLGAVALQPVDVGLRADGNDLAGPDRQRLRGAAPADASGMMVPPSKIRSAAASVWAKARPACSPRPAAPAAAPASAMNVRRDGPSRKYEPASGSDQPAEEALVGEQVAHAEAAHERFPLESA